LTKKHIRIRLVNDLIYINLFSILLIAAVFLSEAVRLPFLRIALGLPFVLFFPGYTLIAALFPKKDDLDGLERLALSFGLSIAVAPLLGLGLNYTPWGIRLTPILLSLTIFILGMSVVAFYRRSKISAENRFYPVWELDMVSWGGLSRLDKILSVLLALSIFFAVGSIFYVATTPKVGEKFTEFYILGTGGKAEGYPRELAVGEEGWVIVGVVNHEYAPVKYYIEVVEDGNLYQRLNPIELAHEQKWEERVSFAAAEPRKNMKVEFLLYREGVPEPYRSVHLWVDVGIV